MKVKNEQIAKYLQNKRKELGITQKELADTMGVTFQAVSRWEKGDSIPDLDSLCNLADYYEVTIDEILQREIIKTEEEIENAHIFIFGAIIIINVFGIIIAYTFFNLPWDLTLFGRIGFYLLSAISIFTQNIYYFAMSEKRKIDKQFYISEYIMIIISIIIYMIIQ